MLAAIITGGSPGTLVVVVVALAATNAIAAGIMGISGRLNYVGAFILSTLLVLLIGLGICTLLLSNTGGMH